MSQRYIFDCEKKENLINVLVLLMGVSNLGSLNPESDALPIDPPPLSPHTSGVTGWLSG